MNSLGFKKPFNLLFGALKEFAYPSICLHCLQINDHKNKHLCADCLTHLKFIDPQERCQSCFIYLEDSTQKICLPCLQSSYPFTKVGAVFDYTGPAKTLVKAFKYENQPYLASGLSSYLALQFLELNWPMPNLIVPVPISWMKSFSRGFNQSQLLAENLGSILNCPVKNLLKRKCGEFSQAGLSRKQRKEINSTSFTLKRFSKIEDKRILLIDDVITTCSTLDACSKELLKGFPSEIYALSLCRAIS